MRSDPEASLEAFLPGWVASGEITAAFAAVALEGRTVWSAGASRPGEPTPGGRALFDAASLTKPWMATLALRLDVLGELALATRLREIWPDAAARLAARTLDDLLRHRAGFRPWTPLYRRSRSKAGAERLLVSGRSSGAAGAVTTETPGAPSPPRPGSNAAYSDLDYILWGLAAERRLDEELAALLRRGLLEPLGIDGVERSPGPRPDVVECRCDNALEVELAAAQSVRVSRRGPPGRGEPQDGNARFLGGLAAHAGLFVTAEALLALGHEWLRALDGAGRLLSRRDAERALAGSGAYALGWARRRVAGSAGPALAPSAFGHAGFTGTSLWIDPTRRALFVLLAHRATAGGMLNGRRRRFHRLAAAHLDAISAQRPAGKGSARPSRPWGGPTGESGRGGC